jgi:1-aminocyclopropane-1-carboxylate deaminase/D-cysteine desulfhydrase-like pyridoxal-dependent ACC family enzyme
MHAGNLTGAMLPLFRRFPALANVPRVPLSSGPTPLEHVPGVHDDLWIKRDDLFADPLGGNKARALEFLLGNVLPNDLLVTVGSEGSTHALSVATYGRRLGAHVAVGRWRQVMNPTAARISAITSRLADEAPMFRSVFAAYAWAWRRRRRDRNARWIAAGGSTPLGILGHVNAGLELADQIHANMLPVPARVVVPFGTGGTSAGLALAFEIAGVKTTVIGVRVVSLVIGRRARTRRLASDTARLIEGLVGRSVPRPGKNAIQVAHGAFGGAYGRETEIARTAAARLRDASGIELDASYSAKAFQVAVDLAEDGPTLFWLTFDSRALNTP